MGVFDIGFFETGMSRDGPDGQVHFDQAVGGIWHGRFRKNI